jgi:hypothetical protein
MEVIVFNRLKFVARFLRCFPQAKFHFTVTIFNFGSGYKE